MNDVTTLGEVLVEVMALDPGRGFREPIRLQGPYPSGAPAIFIDQVAKMGQPCSIIGCVGDDDFGHLNIDRLARDGVRTDAVEVLRGRATGTAFVRYGHGGERDFVHNIRDSASGHLRFGEPARQALARSGHLHISGSSLFSASMVSLVNQAVQQVHDNGGTVSFDLNARRDAIERRGARRALRNVLAHCDMFLPSGPELTLLTDAQGPDEAVREILALGVSCVVVKRGSSGCTYYDRAGRLDQPGFPTEEVDATGAGDCFDGAFVTCRLQGQSPPECLANANAAGALAIAALGPMEGTSTFAQLDALRHRAAGHKPRS